MKKFGIGFISAAALVLGLSAWAASRPALTECGSQLPEGVSYTVTLNGTWDTRTNPVSGDISITLMDEVTGIMPHPIPEQAQPFVACIKSAVGI
ncbi:MAG: hypothetical protein DHS20C11_28590 [Lysobacteraceae bacterium]|nr:MAG: hypothetical protein DHS20C11_28590 [Xanthomonadaceae bacterium]